MHSQGGEAVRPHCYFMGDAGREGEGGAVVLHGMLPNLVRQGGGSAMTLNARDAGAAKGDEADRPRRPQRRPG